MSVPPGVVTPDVSLACRFELFPNAFRRPMMLPIVGVLGVGIALASGDDAAAGDTGFPPGPHPEKSSASGVGAPADDVETEPRRVRREK